MKSESVNALCFLVCENYKEEVAFAIESEGLDHVDVRTFPAHCGHPQIRWDDLGPTIHACEKEYSRICLLGGSCIAGLEDPPLEMDCCRVHKMDQCFPMFINKKLLDGYLKEGAYLLSAGWLRHWKRHVDEWGFDRETARNFFAESVRQLVLLDTGVHMDSADHLQALADFVGRPFKIVPVGTEFLQLFLARIVLEWRLDEHKSDSGNLLSEAKRQLADYSMALDLIANMTGVIHEKEAIKNIFELFTMLCSPDSIVYIPLIDGKPGHIQSHPAVSVDAEFMKNPIAVFRDDYAWSESGDGFVLKISHQDDTMGILKVDGFTFPEYKEYYLNAALSISGVFGLSIANARAYERIRLTEEALRESEERFRLLYEDAPLPYQSLDEKGCLIQVNKAWAETLGYTREEVVGKWFGDFIHEDSKEHFINNFPQFLAAGKIKDIQFKMVKKDGTFILTSFQGKVGHNETSNFKQTHCIFHDVTRQKFMEEEMVKARKLEALRLLSGGIAHDFNNLLSVILGNISMAGTALVPDDPASGFLHNAEKGSLKARDLLREFLLLSDAGLPVKTEISMGALLTECLSHMDKHQDMGCEPSIPDYLWPVVCDREQIGQAIANMMTNAVEAMPGGGTIRVQAENITLSAGDGTPELPLAEGRYVKISIEDEGVGIPETDLPMIFDPYFSTKERGEQKGMGLGLAVAYSVITKHHGVITVHPTPGAGTTFHIYLPATDAEYRKPISKPVEIETQSSIDNRQSTIHRVLVMDDEEMLRDLLQGMLDLLGYEAAMTADGSEALALYEKAMGDGEPFSAVILDLTNRGGMGGLETVKRLREMDPDVKAIVSSGYSDDPAIVHFREHGFSDSLPKPFMMKDLEEKLKSLLQEPRKGLR